jgi:hypothetical protein
MHNVQPHSNPYTSTTSTTSTPPHLVATLSGNKNVPQTFNCEQAINDVTDILWDYKDWTDPLSKSLSQWGVDVLKLKSVTDEGLLNTALTMIEYLQKNILVNPLDCVNHSPLSDPVLERQWTWEKSWFKQWPLIDDTGLSPFDKQPMGAVKPHTFALEMLKWLGGLPLNTPKTLATSSPTPNNSSPLIVQAGLISPVNKSLFTFLLNKAAQNYAVIASVRDVRQDIVKTSKLAEKLTEQTKKQCEQEREKLQEDMKAHEKRLAERLEHIDLNHESTVNVLKSDIKQGKHKLEVLAEKHKDLQEKADNLDTQNRSMQSTIAYMQGQINNLNNRGGGGGFCIIS